MLISQSYQRVNSRIIAFTRGEGPARADSVSRDSYADSFAKCLAWTGLDCCGSFNKAR